MTLTCDISLAENGRYIVLKYVGDVDRVTILSNTIRAHEIARAAGVDRFLVDMTEARNVESVTGNYRFANSDLADPRIDRFARVAVLVSPDDHSHDFAVTASQNAFVRVRLFTDRGLAEEYLM